MSSKKGPSQVREMAPPAEPQRRGRGRPRNPQEEPTSPPTPKRPRGRPRGSKNKGPRATPKKAEPVGEKRPRGRPRKWPQKVVQEEEQQLPGKSIPAHIYIALTPYPQDTDHNIIISDGEPEEVKEGPSQSAPTTEGE